MAGKRSIEYRGREVREQYLALMATSFPPAAVERKRQAWDWLFDTPQAQAGHPTHVMTIEQDGRIIGATMLLPGRFVVNGAITQGRVLMGIVVDPSHRGDGVRLILHIIRPDPGELRIGITINDKLNQVVLRSGGKISPPRILLRRFYRPGRMLAKRGRLPQPAALLLDALYRPVSAVARRAPHPARNERILPVERFDAAFDAAFERARLNIGLAQVRSSGFLNWRYVDAPFASYDSRALFRDGELAGYVVLNRADTPIGLFGRVTDIFAYAGTARDYALLLGEADRVFRAWGCDSGQLSSCAMPVIDAAARMAGFGFRKHTRPLILKHADDDKTQYVADHFDRVHFFRGDHDEDY